MPDEHGSHLSTLLDSNGNKHVYRGAMARADGPYKPYIYLKKQTNAITAKTL